jgi:hypothetical protein
MTQQTNSWTQTKECVAPVESKARLKIQANPNPNSKNTKTNEIELEREREREREREQTSDCYKRKSPQGGPLFLD